MRILPFTSLLVAVPATHALAAETIARAGGGIMTSVFLGICALIIVAQLVPALILFIGMAKAWVDLIQRDLVAASRSPWMAGVHEGVANDDLEEGEPE